MSEPHSFEYDGLTIRYKRATVESAMEAHRIRQKLVNAYDLSTISDSLWGNFTEYSHAMARMEKVDAAWWSHSNMSAQAVQDAYERFIEEDEALYVRFQLAAQATQAPKKTTPITTETPTP